VVPAPAADEPAATPAAAQVARLDLTPPPPADGPRDEPAAPSEPDPDDPDDPENPPATG